MSLLTPQAAWFTGGMTYVACKDADINLFFSTSPAKTAEAKAICARCLLIKPCRERAMADPEIEGVWGGLTLVERNAIRASVSAARPRRTDGSTGPREPGPRAYGVL